MELSIDITNFTSGELSPRMKGRFDHKAYYNGCDTLLNMVVMPQGGATKRPGTLYVANNKEQSLKARLKAFIFSNQQPYMLQFSNGNVRIHKNDGTVLSGGLPVDVAVPYQTADLPALKWAQSADTLFIAHPNYPPASLTRSSDTSWTYTVLTFLDGPWLNENTSTNAVTPSGTSGSITLTWANTTGINGGAGFTSQDIGRVVRLKLYSLWAWCKITAVTNTRTVTATVQAKVNDGADGSIDGQAWASGTLYVAGTVVIAGGKYYICVDGGLSGANGPVGDGKAILDGSVIWSSLTAFDASAWAQSTFYNLGDIVYGAAQPGYYQAEVAGKSSSGGTGPTGTGSGIVDASMVWNYLAPFTLPSSTVNWQLGAYSPGAGYPYTVRFWQQRLMWGGFPAAPNQLFASQTGDFLNHAPTKSDGSVLDSSALSFILDDDKVQAIQWMIGAGSAQAQQLAIGTAAGEQVLQGANAGTALTPTSVQAYPETVYGGALNVEPLRIGKAVLFVDRTGRKIREWAYYWQQGGYVGPDQMQTSDHIARAIDASAPMNSGIAEICYQQAPHQVVWGITNDGQLFSVTYDREQQIWAPARHQLGGNYYGGPPIVEAIDVIPAPDNTYDELWLSVLRTIGGVVTRTIEVMTRYFDGQPQDMAFFVDCGLSSSLTYPAATLTPSGFSNQNGTDPELPVKFGGAGTLTASAPVFSSGDVGKIVRVNGGRIVVQGYTSTTIVTGTAVAPMANLAPAAQNAWSSDPQHQTFSGLATLNGETVAIWGDGAALGTATVAGGGITVPNGEGASGATIGLPYVPILVTMPFEPGRAAAAASAGKLKRVEQVFLRVLETMGVHAGRRITDPGTSAIEDKTEAVTDRKGSDLMDNAPVIFTGVRKLDRAGGFDREGQILIYQEDPAPLTVLAIVANGNVEELPNAA